MSSVDIILQLTTIRNKPFLLQAQNDILQFANPCVYSQPSRSLYQLVQYVGYASKSWKPIPKKYPLPSQEFTRQLVGYLAFHTKAIIVVSRSYNEWKELLGDVIWKKLKDDNRLVCRKTIVDKNGVCRHIRTQSFTKTTFEGDGFDRIAESLGANK